MLGHDVDGNIVLDFTLQREEAISQLRGLRQSPSDTYEDHRHSIILGDSILLSCEETDVDRLLENVKDKLMTQTVSPATKSFVDYEIRKECMIIHVSEPVFIHIQKACDAKDQCLHPDPKKSPVVAICIFDGILEERYFMVVIISFYINFFLVYF